MEYHANTMSQSNNDVMRHVIAALVTNEPGVLAQVAGMFAARGFNIDSLVVGRTENPDLSRMTIVVNGDALTFEQVRKQLQKLVPVVKVVDYKDTEFVERDLMLIQVSTATAGDKDASGSGRSEIVELANLFRARIVDVSRDYLMIEMSGTEDKVEAFIAMIEPYGIVELARTGLIAMPRGHGDHTANRQPITRTRHRHADESDRGTNVDPKDLPPG